MTKIMRRDIRRASKEIREMKEVVPYLFVEYSEMLRAKQELAAAKLKYKKAVDAWNNLGRYDV